LVIWPVDQWAGWPIIWAELFSGQSRGQEAEGTAAHQSRVEEKFRAT